MPHLVLSGAVDWRRAGAGFGSCLDRWGRAVLKLEERWLKVDGEGLLVAGVVVEYSRPQHPVATVTPHHQDTIVRLWPLAPVERTPAVQRWLGLVARELQRCGGGRVVATNIAAEHLVGLGLEIEPRQPLPH